MGAHMDPLSALRLSNSIPATRALEARPPAGVEHSLSHTMPSAMPSTLLAQSGSHNHRQQRQPPTAPLRQWHRERLEGHGGHSSAGAGSGGRLASASIEGYRDRRRERGRRRERSRPPDPASTTSSTITSVTTNASSFEVDGEVSHDEQEAGLRTAVAAQRARGPLRSRRKAPGEPPFSPTYSPLVNVVVSSAKQQQHAHPHDSAGRNRREAHSHSVERQRRRRREQTHRQPSHSVDASPIGSPVVMRRHHQQAEAGEVDPGTYPSLSVELDQRAIANSGPLSQRLLALAPRTGAAIEAPLAPTRVSSLAPRDPSARPLSPHPGAAYFAPDSNSLPNSMRMPACFRPRQSSLAHILLSIASSDESLFLFFIHYCDPLLVRRTHRGALAATRRLFRDKRSVG